MRTRIENATIVNEGKRFAGTVTVEDERIISIIPATDSIRALPSAEEVVDATGLYLIPGVIDDHVHFREPGLTRKADIATESRAAAAGGVTSYMDMPNVVPQTTTLETLEEKFRLAAEKSLVNYSFFFGATHTHTDLLEQLDPRKVCGVKLFMGSSTGNMLVDREDALRAIFSRSPLPVMTHCEDSALISANQKRYRELYGDDPDVRYHPLIRSEEACFRSTELAVRLARETGARLHVAHVTTAPVNREAGFPYQALLAALGGRDNILRLNNCFTRLRIWVKDVDLLDQQLLRDLAPDGMYCQSREVQLVFGLDAVQVHMTNSSNLPIEALEMEYPLMVEEYALEEDSGGPGKYRGGLGIRRGIRIMPDSLDTSLGAASTERSRTKPWGLMGGLGGATSYLDVCHEGKKINTENKVRNVPLEAGDTVTLVSAGGGGYGDPKERDREAVLRDYREGKISPETIKSCYPQAE